MNSTRFSVLKSAHDLALLNATHLHISEPVSCLIAFVDWVLWNDLQSLKFLTEQPEFFDSKNVNFIEQCSTSKIVYDQLQIGPTKSPK